MIRSNEINVSPPSSSNDNIVKVRLEPCLTIVLLFTGVTAADNKLRKIVEYLQNKVRIEFVYLLH